MTMETIKTMFLALVIYRHPRGPRFCSPGHPRGSINAGSASHVSKLGAMFVGHSFVVHISPLSSSGVLPRTAGRALALRAFSELGGVVNTHQTGLTREPTDRRAGIGTEYIPGRS